MIDVSGEDFSAVDESYAAAKDRLEAMRREWEAGGCELLAQGSMGQVIEHPLVKMMRETEAHVAKLALQLQRRRHRGPAPVAKVSASVGVSPTARLRVAK
jgi:hypothetical protein